jgi:hypothetical protein
MSHSFLRFTVPIAFQFVIFVSWNPSSTWVSLKCAHAQGLAANARILTTDVRNPPFDVSSPTWARNLCGGKKWLEHDPPRYEWVPVLHPTNEADDSPVGISGWALRSKASDVDVPFTHPFGFDWTYMIAPDPPYSSLIAPGTATDVEHSEALQEAAQIGLRPTPQDVLHVETDQGLLPTHYRPQRGDRVVTFGRWIVDCAHEIWQSEIHPPLLVVAARSTSLQWTHSTILGRPYLVSQEFDHGALRAHLIREIVKVIPKVPTIPIPGSTHVGAHPAFLRKPFSGIQVMKFVVRPPQSSDSTHVPTVRFHFTVRRGVALQVFRAESDGVGVIVSMNDAEYSAAALPPSHQQKYSLDQLNVLPPGLGQSIKTKLLAAAIPLAPFTPDPLAIQVTAAVLNKGVLTHAYDPPKAWTQQDSLMATFPLDGLPPQTPVTVDDGQPFPIYGWLDVGSGPIPSPSQSPSATDCPRDEPQGGSTCAQSMTCKYHRHKCASGFFVYDRATCANGRWVVSDPCE